MDLALQLKPTSPGRGNWRRGGGAARASKGDRSPRHLHRQQLGEDLWRLVEETGVPLTEVVVLTRLPRRDSPRGAFRLAFEDGRILKGRRVVTAEQAAAVEVTLALLDRSDFPPVVARHGTALLETWIDGDPLEDLAWHSGLLKSCGALLASIHQTTTAGIELPTRDDDSARRVEALSEKTDDLADRGMLEPALAMEVRAIAADHAPRRFDVGLVHGDFCAENLVLSNDGRICVVDNPTFAFDARALDLARTWYRWPMSQFDFRSFLDGYQSCRDIGDFVHHRLFWAILVLVDAASFRVMAGTENQAVPLRRLRSLVRDADLFARQAIWSMSADEGR